MFLVHPAEARAAYNRCPEGAVTNQPRASPWGEEFEATMSPERALQFSKTASALCTRFRKRKMPRLTILWLADTMVTDAGLAQLKGLPKLERLNLRGTKVTDAGARELGKALPKLGMTR